jgi:phage terminase small subunit
MKIKDGHSATSTAARHAAFVEAYMTNGHNATAAAIACGGSEKQLSNPSNSGWKLLHNPNVQRMLALRAREVAQQHAMSTTNWAASLGAIAFSDIGELVDGDGRLIPVHRLPPHVRAAISSVKVRTTKERATIVEYKL